MRFRFKARCVVGVRASILLRLGFALGFGIWLV